MKCQKMSSGSGPDPASVGKERGKKWVLKIEYEVLEYLGTDPRLCTYTNPPPECQS